jgi:cellulose biosynthesis protein BcsQ
VLVIDLDPQTNATIALIDETDWEQLDNQNQTLFHLFNDKLEKTNYFNLPIITRAERQLHQGASFLQTEGQ